MVVTVEKWNRGHHCIEIGLEFGDQVTGSHPPKQPPTFRRETGVTSTATPATFLQQFLADALTNFLLRTCDGAMLTNNLVCRLAFVVDVGTAHFGHEGSGTHFPHN
jgi:hypothetical protein